MTRQAEALRQSLLHAACCDLLLAHTASYPDEAPLVKISK